jgi:hypothetical protein
MEDEVNPAKVRIGLAIIAVVVLVALGLVVVIDSTIGRAIMFAVALTALVRAYMLYRSLRREQREAAAGS